MEENKSILHELYVYSEWKPEPEYIQKPDGLLPENISSLWRWMRFLGPKKSLIDSVTAHKERQQKWHIALGDEGKVIAVLTDIILEIRTKRSDYATIAARTTVSRDAYSQWRKLVWSPDCAFVVLAYGNGLVSFFDLTASNLFNIPIECSRPEGLECTDNTHAVAEIIFMPLRVKDTKWSWEVLIVNYDGKVRGYLVSGTDGFTLHHSTTLSGGVACAAYCPLHSTLYVATVPRGAHKDKDSAHAAGLTAWRILDDEPHYKLSVVSDQLDLDDKFHLHIPFISPKNLAFIVQMALSPDGSKLVCLHCNGDISTWRLPLLKLMHRFPLATQPGHDLKNPLTPEEKFNKKDVTQFYAADVNWWSNEEVILSRFSGAVSVCDIEDLMNLLGRAEFLQGAPRVTRAHAAAALALECETSVLPARRSDSAASVEVVSAELEGAGGLLATGVQLVRQVLFALTDLEAFQPAPRRVTCVARVYRLLAVRSTTPLELFSRKIEAGKYVEALALAERFALDSDLVYQQQWRRNPVSTDAIHNYLSLVRKKMWAVHQCVDRLPETLGAARELLAFGLTLTNDNILEEINKDLSPEEQLSDPADIRPEHLNAYTSELLRCRHVMLFYKERLSLYECILKFEKSTYQKEEYERLRSNSILRSAIETAKEARIEALTALWSHLKTCAMKLAVLDKVPETVSPLQYGHLAGALATTPPPTPDPAAQQDWCRNTMFRSIWSSNWSEESTPDTDSAYEITDSADDIVKWYERRAREIEERSGLVSHALQLVALGAEGGVPGLHTVTFHLRTLDTLVYDCNLEGVTLNQVESWTLLDTCSALMKMSTPETFVWDLQEYVVPFLVRYERYKKLSNYCFVALVDYLESISVDDLAPILLLLQSEQYKLDVRSHLQLAERCLLAYSGTDQLELACDLLDTILRESDGTISETDLIRRVSELEKLVSGSSKLSWRGVRVPLHVLRDTRDSDKEARALLTRLARSLATDGNKPTQADWEKLLKDILELQSTLFDCVTKEQCYEIYAMALLTSGDLASIRLAAGVVACAAGSARAPRVPHARALHLVSSAAREYFNSASSLVDPALKLAECCLTLIKEDDPEIQEELDLIAALKILHEFYLNVLPIQVRLCEDKMRLVEKCLQTSPSAYHKSHKLLELAALLRISPDDEAAREAGVLQLVCQYSILGGVGGCGVGVTCARRLAALRARTAAPLLAHVAGNAHGHADNDTRRHLYAAAATYCDARDIEEMLRSRLSLELETWEQMGKALQDAALEHLSPAERWLATDEHFADALTTPVIEKRDLLAPHTCTKTTPLFKYLFGSLKNKSALGESKQSGDEAGERTVHLQEFYASLYPEHATSDTYYRYERFSVPDALERAPVSQAVLGWFYVQNSLEDGYNEEMECEVVQKCAEDLLYKDTALSVSCLLRVTQNAVVTSRFIESNLSDAALSAALYATLIQCNAAELADSVYRAHPRTLAEQTLQKQNAREEQLELIRTCIARLSGVAETGALRALGLNVNTLLFNADEDYRAEVIYRVASSPRAENLEMAMSLAEKYSLDPVEVWLQHAAAALTQPHLTTHTLPKHRPDYLHQRILETLYPQISGHEHGALIALFSLLKGVDEKPLIAGLTAADHIKLLKKAKAASPDLDYKLLLEQPTAEELTAHMLDILKPENVGMVGKFLRTLPAAVRLPVSVSELYSKWLTKYFFSVPPVQATSKKWMQQYRQCASYFNKLSQDELLRFLEHCCFSDLALDRVPANTRVVMLTQAADYCAQEQENDSKFNKNGGSWSAVGAELSRWARFLETFHSEPVRNLRGDTYVSSVDDIWKEIEQSHGSVPAILPLLARLVMWHGVRGRIMHSLVQCLGTEADTAAVMRYVADTAIHTADDMQALVSRLIEYHKEGVKFPEELIEHVLHRAAAVGLAPHKQISLLALSERARLDASDDVNKVAQFSLDLFRTEWPDEPFVRELTEQSLSTEAGRRAAFERARDSANTLQRRKALVDVLLCWPPHTDGESVSVHCSHLATLLREEEPREALAYIKLLLRRPLLNEQELQYLKESAPPGSFITVAWILLLSKAEAALDDILQLVNENQETIKQMEMDPSLIKRLLDTQMLIPLVPTVMYHHIVDYIVGQTPVYEKPENVYEVRWAIGELERAKYFAEAGNLYLLAAGAPIQLRGFSETVRYCNNMALFER